ncbi:ribonuclease H-like domain-containing protein [Tanacetum coccineum]
MLPLLHHLLALMFMLFGTLTGKKLWLKQAPCDLVSAPLLVMLLEPVFCISKTDSSLFVFHRGFDIAYLLLYVDDIILTASSSAFLLRIIASLHNEFAMKDLGSLNYFLGISAQRSAFGLVQAWWGWLTLSATILISLPCGASSRILRYVRGTLDYGMQLHVSSTTQLSAYTDADWAGSPVTRRSAEVNNRSVANVVAKTAWIRNLLCELHTPLFTATLVYCDNVSAVYMSANPVQH